MNKKHLMAWYFASALLLGAGCSDSDSGYDPGIEFSKTGEVTLIASIRNCTTRASLVNTGEARWLAGDALSVVCTDGSAVTFTLDGTGGTRRAFFKGFIPEGREMGPYALYPTTTSISGSDVRVTLPTEIEPAATGSCSAMIAPIADSYEITFQHLLSYMTIQFSNVSSSAAKIELKADKNLSGEFTAAIDEAMSEGIAAREGTNTLTIVLPEKSESTVSVSFALPVGDYSQITATAYDANGENLGEAECLTAPIRAELADLRALSVTMPDYSPQQPIEGTVLVAGIYWATGNLQHIVGQTDEGFQTDWRIAPNQWEYVNCENAGASGKAVTFKPTNYDQCDHFNWGGIASPFDTEAASAIVVPVGTDISGKMYTTQDGSTATTDFTEARFGDLAFWASKGQWRMPTQAEFDQLLAKASLQYGSYKLGEGKVITGILFTDPEPGQLPTVNETEVELTADDIAKGLFLPKAGRRYSGEPLNINNQGTQGVYWGAESITGENANKPCYGVVISIQSAVVKYPYWNKAFDATAGFSIRPVYVVK